MHRVRTMLLWLFIVTVMLGTPLLAGGVAARAGDSAVLRVHQRYFPDSLDPQQTAGVDVAAVLGVIYEGLTRLDEDLNIVPAAAESWEFNGDGSAVVFHLRDNLTYSDGSPLTAERFAEAVRRTCDPNIAGDYQHILFDVAGCQEFAELYGGTDDAASASRADTEEYESARANVGVDASDERTLEIRLTHPAPYFPAIVGMPVLFPAKQELIAQGGEAWWRDPAHLIGNGPFQVAQMEPDHSIVFTPNDRYWGGRPRLDRLEYVYVAASEVALEAYRMGDLDIVSLDNSELRSIERDQQLSNELVRFSGASTSYLSFNLTKEPFTDKKVREAFAYAFDRQKYCEQLQDGACLQTLSWIPQGLPGAIATNAYAWDPEKAPQALAESTYGGPEKLPEITYVYWSEEPSQAGVAEWIAGMYRDVLGVAITLRPLKGEPMVDLMTNPETYPQMVLAGWIQDYPDPQNWLSVYWTCAASFAQDTGYCNPDFDALVAKADRELDPRERLALYESAGQLLVDDVPGVFLTHGTFLYLLKPDVAGYAPTAIDAAWPGQTASLLTLNIAQKGE